MTLNLNKLPQYSCPYPTTKCVKNGSNWCHSAHNIFMSTKEFERNSDYIKVIVYIKQILHSICGINSHQHNIHKHTEWAWNVCELMEFFSFSCFYFFCHKILRTMNRFILYVNQSIVKDFIFFSFFIAQCYKRYVFVELHPFTLWNLTFFCVL